MSPCPYCGFEEDTPNHEYGCDVGRLQAANWRQGSDDLWRHDAFGGSFKTENAVEITQLMRAWERNVEHPGLFYPEASPGVANRAAKLLLALKPRYPHYLTQGIADRYGIGIAYQRPLPVTQDTPGLTVQRQFSETTGAHGKAFDDLVGVLAPPESHEPKEEFTLDPADLSVNEVYARGEQFHERPRGVVITHVPTGLESVSTEHDSQLANRQWALEDLRVRLKGRLKERSCPDGGACHHGCGLSGCWRVFNAGPLMRTGWDDWPVYTKVQEMTREQLSRGLCTRCGRELEGGLHGPGWCADKRRWTSFTEDEREVLGRALEDGATLGLGTRLPHSSTAAQVLVERNQQLHGVRRRLFQELAGTHELAPGVVEEHPRSTAGTVPLFTLERAKQLPPPVGDKESNRQAFIAAWKTNVQSGGDEQANQDFETWWSAHQTGDVTPQPWTGDLGTRLEALVDDDEDTSQPREEDGEEHEVVLPELAEREEPLCTCKGPAEDEQDPAQHDPQCPYRRWLLEQTQWSGESKVE